MTFTAPTLFAIVMHALSLPVRIIDQKHASDLAVWVHAAAVAHGASLEDARLATATAAGESAGHRDALSRDGLDCSIVQLRGGPARRGHTCAELMADPVLAISTWLEDLDEARARCGSTARALGLLATGRCGGAPRLVAFRCALAGVSC